MLKAKRSLYKDNELKYVLNQHDNVSFKYTVKIPKKVK